jgi:hypothetical protein
MAQRKKSRINELSELIAAPVAKIKLVFQSISKPLGSDPDEYVTSQMSAEQRAELKEKQDQDAKKNKGRKEPENASQVQPAPKPEASEPEWWYEHSSEYDQNGCRTSETSNDVYQQMRDRLAQDFARQMRNQRPY